MTTCVFDLRTFFPQLAGGDYRLTVRTTRLEVQGSRGSRQDVSLESPTLTTRLDDTAALIAPSDFMVEPADAKPWHRSRSGLESRMLSQTAEDNTIIWLNVYVRNPTDEEIKLSSFASDGIMTLDGVQYQFRFRPILDPRTAKYPVFKPGWSGEFFSPVLKAQKLSTWISTSNPATMPYLRAGRHTASFSLGAIETDTIEFAVPDSTAGYR